MCIPPWNPRRWSTWQRVSTGIAFFAGLLIVSTTDVSTPKPDVVSPSRGGSSGQPSSSLDSSPQEEPSLHEDSGMLIAYRDVVEKQGNETESPTPSPRPSSSPPQPSSLNSSSAALGKRGIDSLAVAARVRDASKLAAEFGVWIRRGNKLKGEYVAPDRFLRRSSDYVREAFQIAPRAIPVKLTSQMQKVARRKIGYWSNSFKASVMLKKKGQQQIVRKMDRRARRRGRRFDPRRPSRYAKKVSIDLQGDQVTVTSVTWR